MAVTVAKIVSVRRAGVTSTAVMVVGAVLRARRECSNEIRAARHEQQSSHHILPPDRSKRGCRRRIRKCSAHDRKDHPTPRLRPTGLFRGAKCSQARPPLQSRACPFSFSISLNFARFSPSCVATFHPDDRAAAAAAFEVDIVLTISDYHGRPGRATFNSEFTVDGLPDEISTLDFVCAVFAVGRWTVRLAGGQIELRLDCDLRQTNCDLGLRVDGQ